VPGVAGLTGSPEPERAAGDMPGRVP
jgi:hypothetical protein